MRRRKPTRPRSRRRGVDQAGETWQVARVLLQAWVGRRGEEPRRPWLMIVISLPAQVVVGYQIVADKPAPEAMISIVERTKASPQVGPPRRPDRIVCSEPELVGALRPRFEPEGVACELGEAPEIGEVVKSLEEHLRGKPHLPGLIDSRGVMPEQVGRLFAAAAYFYREAPWRYLSDEHPIEVHFPADSADVRYIVVMGSSGVEFGLAVYRKPEHLAAAYTRISPDTLIKLFDQEAITYGKMQDQAFSDLDALERYGWEVAGPNAYPLPLIFTRRGKVKRPEARDIVWYEAVLRAIPRFVTEQLKPKGGRVRPADASFTVPLARGDGTIRLRYPPE